MPLKARFSSCYAKEAYKKGRDSKVQESAHLICKSSQVQHEGLHNAPDYMPIRKMGKPLMLFKARLTHFYLAIIFGRLEDSFYQGMFPDNFLQTEHCSYPFAFQVDEALHKLLAEHCSRAGVIGFFGGGGRLRHSNLLEELEQSQQPCWPAPQWCMLVVGWHYRCPRELLTSHFAFWCSSAKLHVGSFSVSPCSFNANIPQGPKVAGWKTHPSFWPRSSTGICTRLVLSMWVATLISTEQSTCSSLCTFGSRGEKDTWFFGHLFYIPLVEIPPKREPCSRMALNYITIFISITCGLPETCYELSGILHPRQVETTGPAADCVCLVGWFSYCFPPHPVFFLIPISDTLAAEKSYSCSRNVIFTQNNFYLAWLPPSAIKW